jgi:hypothetical protein
MIRKLSVAAAVFSLILGVASSDAQDAESKDLESAIAALALRQDFPNIADIQASLRISFAERTPLVTSTFYKADSNGLGIISVTLSNPESGLHGVIINLKGAPCATPSGVAKLVGVHLIHTIPPGVDGGPGTPTIVARINRRRSMTLWAASDQSCLESVHMSEERPLIWH